MYDYTYKCKKNVYLPANPATEFLSPNISKKVNSLVARTADLMGTTIEST
jgi:hypothetical protein